MNVEAQSKRILGLLKKIKPVPEAVEGPPQLSFRQDSTGDPAVWITMKVDDDHAKPIELAQWSQRVAQEVIDANLGVWPYVRFRSMEKTQKR